MVVCGLPAFLGFVPLSYLFTPVVGPRAAHRRIPSAGTVEGHHVPTCCAAIPD